MELIRTFKGKPKNKLSCEGTSKTIWEQRQCWIYAITSRKATGKAMRLVLNWLTLKCKERIRSRTTYASTRKENVSSVFDI